MAKIAKCEFQSPKMLPNSLIEESHNLANWMNRKKWDLVAVGALAGFVLLFFSEILFTAKPLLGLDFVSQFYPWKKFIYENVWSRGTLPFWNPYLFSGIPFIVNIQASMFYPLGFLYYLMPPDLAYGYSTILHIILGSLFMYLFMRTLSVSGGGSFVSAFIFSFNGYFTGHVYAGHLSFVQNYIWIPLIFHLLYRFSQRTHLKYAIGAGLVLGTQILGGFPQIAFYTILGCLFFGLFHGAILLRDHAYRNALKLGIGLVSLLVVGFALAAVQILPTMEFSGLSTRAGGISYAFATYESLHPKEMLAFMIPELFGNPIDRTYWRSPEFWHFWESCGYVGILPLFLLFIKTRYSSIRHLRIFFSLLIILSLSLALGKYNPLYPLIYKLPGFDSFRIPAQIIFLYVFAMAVVSGMGFQALEGRDWSFNKIGLILLPLIGALLIFFLLRLSFSPFNFFFMMFKNFAEGPVTHANLDMLYERVSLSVHKGALLFFCSMLLVMLLKRQMRFSKALKMLASLIIMTDLYLFGAQFIKTYEFVTSPQKQALLARMHRSPDQGRVVTGSNLFLPNDGLRYQFPSILGYDPLVLRRYVYYIQSSQNQKLDDHVVHLAGINNPSAKLLKLLNTKKWVLGEKIVDLHNGGSYLNIVSRAVIRPPEKVLSFMKSDEFDPENMVVLEEGYESDSISQEEVTPISASGSVLAYDNEGIRIRTSSDQRGYLVLSEIFYPGWRATVDGKGVPVLRGNYLFRVIPLERGDHEVNLHFISWPFRAGMVVSLFTLTLSLLFIAWSRRHGRQASV